MTTDSDQNSKYTAQRVFICLIFVILLLLNSIFEENKFDSIGRLISSPNKTSTTCPNQSKGTDTAVLLAIGQSNSANHAEKKVTTKYPKNVFNYFNGKCYVAASPLLGATGEKGEFITLLADKLIEKKTYKSVVIVSSGIGGTPIARWQAGGDLNDMLSDIITSVQKNYRVTDVVWHQGEADYFNGTSADEYEQSFKSLRESLLRLGVKSPIFISIATKCTNSSSWKVSNAVGISQERLTNGNQAILAANTDTLLDKKDRLSDGCHFSESGQYKAAIAYAEAISKYRKRLAATPLNY